ncbi:hypothetical protein CR513_24524, partial [Mucuna pruriens]
MFEDFKKSMMNEFEMIDFGMMHHFLGIKVIQTNDRIFLSKKKKKYTGEYSDSNLYTNTI